MEKSIPTSASIKSEKQQEYFYGVIETKITKIKDYKRKANMLFIVALISLLLTPFIQILPTFRYQSISTAVVFLIFLVAFLISLYFKEKVRLPPENECIFYRLRKIKKCLFGHDQKKAENELKSLIFYVNTLKESYPNEPFTDRIFKNLSMFEEKLRTSLYPSLKHSNAGIAKNTERYLNNALKFAMEGDLDAICNIDTTGLDSDKISLDDLYEPTRFKMIYKNIKDVVVNSKAGYFFQFLIVLSLIVIVDFVIKNNWELVKDDFTNVLLISATIMLGYVAYLTFLRDERRT